MRHSALSTPSHERAQDFVQKFARFHDVQKMSEHRGQYRLLLYIESVEVICELAPPGKEPGEKSGFYGESSNQKNRTNKDTPHY